MFTPENLRILQALTSQLLADLTNNRLAYSEQEMLDLQQVYLDLTTQLKNSKSMTLP